MARHRLRHHEGLPAHAALPPLADVLALIDREETPGGHWYWLGDFSAEHEPLMPWRVPGVPGEPRARLAVPRLLHQLMGSFQPRAGVLNACGLVSCANPSHWDVETVADRGKRLQPIVLADFHGHGWQNVQRTEMCEVCFQPPARPCDPVFHDADYRRRMAHEATACSICFAPPYEDCREDVHQAVFRHYMKQQQINILDAKGVVHMSTPAPEDGWYFCICDEPRNREMVYAYETKQRVSAPVTCLECLAQGG